MRFIVDALRKLFASAAKPKPDMADMERLEEKHRQNVDDFIATIKESYGPDDYVRLTDFVHGVIQQKVKSGEIERPDYNLIVSTLSGSLSHGLAQGKCSYYYPVEPRRESDGSPIVFAYDCYVPVHELADRALYIDRLSSSLDKLRHSTFRRNNRGLYQANMQRMDATASYLNGISELEDKVHKAEDLDQRMDLGFFEQGVASPIFTSSAVMAGGGFDFVMRPKSKGGIPRLTRKQIRHKTAATCKPTVRTP